MKTRDSYLDLLESGAFEKELLTLYPGQTDRFSEAGIMREEDIPRYDREIFCYLQPETIRFVKLLKQLPANEPTWLFSSPGRTELAGNHTDHNNGCVLAAAVHLDCVAAVQKRSDSIVILESSAYPEPFRVDLNQLQAQADEAGTTTAIIRGVAAGLKKHGYKTGGFLAKVDSNIPQGAGLSSSASIEVLLAAIFNTLYNSGKINIETMARIGQYAEQLYYGKPCGLMDQLSCAHGGIITIDFFDPEKPRVRKIDGFFQDYALFAIHTGADHADLTADYASIPQEMKATAALFGKKTCRDISMEELLHGLNRVRKELGDRHLLRCYHFLHENIRVAAMTKCLEHSDIPGYLKLVKASGDSSFKYLQNCFSPRNPGLQGISIGLALIEQFMEEGDGVCRVHGGGFAGTVQVYVREDRVDAFVPLASAVFGSDAITRLKIRKAGIYCFS